MGKCYACGGSIDEYAKGGHVKGVHKPIKAIVDDEHGMGEEARGVSHAGILARQGRGYSAKEEKERGYYADAKADHKKVLGEMHSMRRDRKNLAEGGFVEDEEMSGYHDMPMEGHMDDYDYPPDIVDEIIMSRAKGYSEGGKVSNDVGEGQDVDKMPNQFDALVKDDDLEFSYDGDNSGDEIGNEAEDDDERDVVDQIMKSRKKKDKMPHPA